MSLYRRLILGFLLTPWLGMAAGCREGDGKKSEPPLKAVGSKEEKKKASREQPPEPTWEPPDKPVKLGDLQVKIGKATIGWVPLKDALSLPDRDTGKPRVWDSITKEKLLTVNLELLNLNPTKKVEYHSWAGKDFSFDRNFATLKDNFDNRYKRISFGLGSNPIGAVKGSKSIYPNKLVTDVLVFEEPVDSAKHLYLELPGKNYGSEGMLRFRITMEFVRMHTAKDLKEKQQQMQDLRVEQKEVNQQKAAESDLRKQLKLAERNLEIEKELDRLTQEISGIRRE